MITKCRVCNGEFFPDPILVYDNMPKAAQYLPDENELAEDGGITLNICQCSQCGLVQLTNDPVSYYKEVIRAVGISEKMRNFRKQQFSDWIDRYNLDGSNVIEVGCGHGEYLEVMKSCGVNAYGMEQNLAGVSDCLTKGLDVTQNYMDRNFDVGTYSTKKFDAFFILNFLEHMPDPNALFQGVRKILKPGGIGLVEVPNFDMNIRNNLFSEFISDHLFYFTKESLSFLINKNGFEILEMKEVWHDYMISAVIRVREPLELSAFRGCEMKLREDLDRYLEKHQKVAVWGAGHQALTVFSMADLKNRISYVIDSAPFKQGKYTPVTHIKIVNPDTIISDPVDAIIVMAGGYTDSVVAKIRKTNINVFIAVLDNYRLKET